LELFATGGRLLGSFENKNLLHRYWLVFEGSFGGSYGVTAYSYDDALTLLKKCEFKDKDAPKIKKIIEDVEISSLDAGHILPNMGVVTIRGIWYPRIPEAQTK
jgi:hypothetical protein